MAPKSIVSAIVHTDEQKRCCCIPHFDGSDETKLWLCKNVHVKVTNAFGVGMAQEIDGDIDGAGVLVSILHKKRQCAQTTNLQESARTSWALIDV